VRTGIQRGADDHVHEPVRFSQDGRRARNDDARTARNGIRGHPLSRSPTRASWLAFTVETIFLPFDRESTPELELETNFIWLSGERTGGWLSSHFDIVDKFSPATRPTDRRAYTHKLNLELDTSVSVFNWLPEGEWLRGVELEGSLDYVATGLPTPGDRVDGSRFLDRASPWSFSFVVVVPIAPF
jgi:hypothetical protein